MIHDTFELDAIVEKAHAIREADFRAVFRTIDVNHDHGVASGKLEPRCRHEMLAPGFGQGPHLAIGL
jgi:hypothetical protein